MTASGLAKSCEEVISQLVDLQRRAMEYARRNGHVAEDELFYAEQNARLVRNAEAYYRSMFLEEVSSWNLREPSYGRDARRTGRAPWSAGWARQGRRLGP
jgi:erythromycin esterase-like protein